MSLPELTLAELRHIVWEQCGIRMSPSATEHEMHDVLQNRLLDPPQSPVNEMRNHIMWYIDQKQLQLALACDGDCYKHHDLLVLRCYRELLADQEENERRDSGS